MKKKIKLIDLKVLLLKVLRSKYNEEMSTKIMEGLIFAELSGTTSHGIVRLIEGYTSMMAQKPTGEIEVIKKSNLSYIIDAKNNPAIAVVAKATDLSIVAAKQNGFGICGTKNTNSTSGCLGFYLEKIAKNDLIGFIFARSDPLLAPFDSTKALFGTNPIGFAIPSKDNPIIFDMSATEITYGEVIASASNGLRLKKEVALDKDVNETIDPKEVIDNGALLPFGNSYKASGIAMIVEILSGILPGAGFMTFDRSNWGNTVMCIKPDLLIDIDEFKEKVEILRSRLKSTATKSGEEMRIPGEVSLRKFNKYTDEDFVEVESTIFSNIVKYKN